MKPNAEVNSGLPREGEGEILDDPAKDKEGPLPLRALLTRPVVVSVANYGMVALLEMITETLIPLIWSTSVVFGGLGMSPASIGSWMGGYGFMNCIFQLIAFPHIVRRFGPRRVFIASIILFFPVYIMFPFENLALHHSSHGLNPTTGLLIMLQLSAMSFSAMGFGKFFPRTLHCPWSLKWCGSRGSIFMYISSAAPNKRSLGATNGLAQTVVSIQRTIAPAAAATLFAFSLENNILGGNFAYVLLVTIVCVGLGVAVQLPKNTWKHNEQ
jgi:MFS family permease